MQNKKFSIQLPYDLESAAYDTIVLTLPIEPPSEDVIFNFRNIMFNLHNLVREQANLPLFQYDYSLEVLAQKQSAFMSEKNLLFHTEDLGEKITKAKYTWKTIGENIAYHTWTGDTEETAEAIFRGWMNSPGHRKNILNPNFRDIGIGFWVGGDIGFSTVVFGTKQEPRPQRKRRRRKQVYAIQPPVMQ